MATLLKVSTFAVVLSVATQRSPKEMCHCVVLCQYVVATSPKRKTRTLPHYGGRVRLHVVYQRDSSLSFCEALRDNQKKATMETIVPSAVYESWHQCLYYASSFSAPFYGNFKLHGHGSEDT